MRYWAVILCGLALAIGLYAMECIDRSAGLSTNDGRLRDTRTQLQYVARELREYAAKTGHYPSNDQGLVVLPFASKLDPRSFYRNPERLRTIDLGVLTIYADPIVYENRRGLKPGLFADSGANRDTHHVWSVQVDSGIVIWSTEARTTYLAMQRARRDIRIALAITLPVCVVLLTVFVRWRVRYSGPRAGRRALTVAGALAQGIGIAVVTAMAVYVFIPRATCYLIGYVRHPSARSVKDYVALMTKYHDRGIISDKAYRKMREAAKYPY